MQARYDIKGFYSLDGRSSFKPSQYFEHSAAVENIIVITVRPPEDFSERGDDDRRSTSCVGALESVFADIMSWQLTNPSKSSLRGWPVDAFIICLS